MSNIHVIIVTYNGIQWINKCLCSVLDSNISLKVILIDNSSTDGTLKFVQNNFPSVIAIDAQANLGFGKANNLGIRMAILDQTKGVFLLNQDAYVEPNTIKRLFSFGEYSQSAGILSPIHFNGDGTHTDIGFENMFQRAIPLNLNDSEVGTIKCWEVPFVNAAAWYIPVNALLHVGGFDPIFTHYGEDNDFVNRIKYFKYKVVVIDDVKIYHDRLQVNSKAAKINFKKFYHGTYVNYLCLAKKPGDSATVSLLKIIIYCLVNFSKELSSFKFKYAIMHLTHLKNLLKIFKTLQREKSITRQSGAFLNL